MLSCVISFVGLLVVAYLLWDVLYTCWILFVAKPLDLGARYGKNSYAIITGGSKGIGLGLARQLAKQNFNLVLIARKLEDLRLAQQQIKALNPGVDVLIRSFDFNTLGEGLQKQDMWALLDLPRDLDYSILVNNVGMGTSKSLKRYSEEQIKAFITVNCTSQVVMSHMMLGHFKQRQKQSCMIHTSSLANKFEFANLELYGGTKYFNKSFGLKLLDDPKLDSYVFSLGMTETDMTKDLRGHLKISVEECTSSAIKFVGRWRSEFHGHWKHELLNYVIRLLPAFVLQRIGNK